MSDRAETKLRPPPELDDFPDLANVTGTLPGTYTIKIDPNAQGMIHPTRRQPVRILREKILEKLKAAYVKSSLKSKRSFTSESDIESGDPHLVLRTYRQHCRELIEHVEKSYSNRILKPRAHQDKGMQRPIPL